MKKKVHHPACARNYHKNFLNAVNKKYSEGDSTAKFLTGALSGAPTSKAAYERAKKQLEEFFLADFENPCEELRDIVKIRVEMMAEYFDMTEFDKIVDGTVTKALAEIGVTKYPSPSEWTEYQKNPRILEAVKEAYRQCEEWINAKREE